MLRWIGLIGLTGTISPVRHPAKRRRLKTVIQELMVRAARLIATGRCLKLRFSRHCTGYRAFDSVYRQLVDDSQPETVLSLNGVQAQGMDGAGRNVPDAQVNR
jgi:hypothetical protein